MAYKTEQREQLIAFLASHAPQQFTLGELAEEVMREGQIGRATVYRLMKKLAEEGVVRSFTIGDKRAVYYQYVGGVACDSHLHLKCMVCGRLYHLSGCVSTFMEKQIYATHRFVLDEHATMLFGTCQGCRGGN